MSYYSVAARENLQSFFTKAVALLRSRPWLFLFGIISELVYSCYLLHSYPLMGYFQSRTFMEDIDNFSRVSFLIFLFTFTMLFLLFGLAWWEMRKFQDRTTLWIILGFGGVFTLTTIFIYPLTSPDIYTYIVRSLVMLQHHANPITTSPDHFPNDPLMQLAGANIDLSSPYGPLCIFLQDLPVLIAGRNVLLALVLTKFMFSAMLIASAFLVYKILSDIAPSFALRGAFALACNPFTLFEYSINSHNDIAMMFLVILAIFVLLKERPTWAIALITASALVKFASVVIIPLFFIYSIVHQPTLQKRVIYSIKAGMVCLLLVIGSFAPFWVGMQTLARFLKQIANLRFSFSSLLYDMSAGGISSKEGQVIGWVLFGICFLYALWLCTKDFPSLLKGCCLTMFAFLLFSATYTQVWYLIWPFALAMLVPETWLLLAAILPLYAAILEQPIAGYLIGWGPSPSVSSATVDVAVYIAIFFPPLMWLIATRSGIVSELDEASDKLASQG
ncbi:MAG TPA: hypothetical protein VGL94_20850 [Ktedonobacteraceae bacterium]